MAKKKQAFSLAVPFVCTTFAVTIEHSTINKNEKLCDGLGMQGYVGGYGQQAGCMNPNDIKLFGNAIKFYSDMGLEVHVTELALSNYEKEKAVFFEIRLAQ